MPAAAVPKRSGREKTTYMLSPDLIKTVKLEAVELGARPAHVVERRLRESYRRQPLLSPKAARPA